MTILCSCKRSFQRCDLVSNSIGTGPGKDQLLMELYSDWLASNCPQDGMALVERYLLTASAQRLKCALVDGVDRSWLIELLNQAGAADRAHALSLWELPNSPVTPQQVHSACPDVKGAALGSVLLRTLTAWKSSRFTLSAELMLEAAASTAAPSAWMMPADPEVYSMWADALASAAGEPEAMNSFPELPGDAAGEMRTVLSERFREFSPDPRMVVFGYDHHTDKSDVPSLEANPQLAADDSMAARRSKQLMREFSGMICCADSGRVIARRMHQIFHINEQTECLAELIDLNNPHTVLVAGNRPVVSPVPIGSQLRWACETSTCSDVARAAASFAEDNQQFEHLAVRALERGFTPVFELCRPATLSLLALRHNVTGLYLLQTDVVHIAAVFGVPVVEQWCHSASDVASLEGEMKCMSHIESLMIKFNDGRHFKLAKLIH